MKTGFTDFSEYTTGSLPSDWSIIYDTVLKGLGYAVVGPPTDKAL